MTHGQSVCDRHSYYRNPVFGSDWSRLQHFMQLLSLSSWSLQLFLHRGVIVMVLTSFVDYDDEWASCVSILGKRCSDSTCLLWNKCIHWSQLYASSLESAVRFICFLELFLLKKNLYFLPGSLHRWWSYNEMYRYLIVCCLCSSYLQASAKRVSVLNPIFLSHTVTKTVLDFWMQSQTDRPTAGFSSTAFSYRACSRSWHIRLHQVLHGPLLLWCHTNQL